MASIAALGSYQLVAIRTLINIRPQSCIHCSCLDRMTIRVLQQSMLPEAYSNVSLLWSYQIMYTIVCVYVHQVSSSQRWPVTRVENTAWHSLLMESCTRGEKEMMGSWDMGELREWREGGGVRGRKGGRGSECYIEFHQSTILVFFSYIVTQTLLVS